MIIWLGEPCNLGFDLGFAPAKTTLTTWRGEYEDWGWVMTSPKS